MSKIGEYLKKVRTEKHLSIEEVSVATGIRTQYLEALEQGEYSKIPGDVFIKGFIRNYGNSLGVDGNALVEEYKASTQPQKTLKENSAQEQAPADATVQAAMDAVITRNKQRSKPKAPWYQGFKNAVEDIKTFIYDNLYETVEEEYEDNVSVNEAEPVPPLEATQVLKVEPKLVAPVLPPSEKTDEPVKSAPVAEPYLKQEERVPKKQSRSFFNFKIFAGVFAVLLLVFAGVMAYFLFGGKGANTDTNLTAKAGSGVKSAHSSSNAVSDKTPAPSKEVAPVEKKTETKKEETKKEETKKEETKKEETKKEETKKEETKPADTATRGSGDGLTVEITYKEPVWTQVTADGKGIEAAIIPKGATRVYKANNEVKVNLGAIRNVEIKVNGKLVPYGEKEWGEGTKIFRK